MGAVEEPTAHCIAFPSSPPLPPRPHLQRWAVDWQSQACRINGLKLDTANSSPAPALPRPPCPSPLSHLKGGRWGGGDGLAEGVQVDDDQVDRLDLVPSDGLHVPLVVAHSKKGGGRVGGWGSSCHVTIILGTGRRPPCAPCGHTQQEGREHQWEGVFSHVTITVCRQRGRAPYLVIAHSEEEEGVGGRLPGNYYSRSREGTLPTLLSRTARMPPCTAGCSVLTRPSSISGKPVTSST